LKIEIVRLDLDAPGSKPSMPWLMANVYSKPPVPEMRPNGPVTPAGTLKVASRSEFFSR
jgi:hypothetical protein